MILRFIKSMFVTLLRFGRPLTVQTVKIKSLSD